MLMNDFQWEHVDHNSRAQVSPPHELQKLKIPRGLRAPETNTGITDYKATRIYVRLHINNSRKTAKSAIS